MTDNRHIAERSQAHELARQLRDRVRGYFPEFAGCEPRIRLADQRDRRNSTLYTFIASAEGAEQRLLVKFPRGPAASGPNGTATANLCPRLFPLPDPAGKAEIEYTTLSRISAHFMELDDPRFGAVHVLDFLPEKRALIMEHVPHPSMSRLLLRSCRLAVPCANIDTVIRNAGSWLRIYHQLPGLAHTRDRHETRDAFLHSLREFVDFLAAAQGDDAWIGNVLDQIESLAHSILPEFLPLGMGHGDYAPRNIFVGPGERVTVFDTLARWRVPIYEDIAHFLIALKLARPQVYSLGLAFNETVIARYEQEFLRGYFQDDVIPHGAITLFEKLLLMDKWAALLHRYRHSAGISRLSRMTMLTLWSRCIRRHLEQPVPQPAAPPVLQTS